MSDFPGSLSIPGTDARIRLGGWVRSTWINSLDPIGSNDEFTPSSIPVGSPTPDQVTGSTLTVLPTRLSLDLRSLTGVGAMRAFVETDFEGSGGAVRLRHAYGRWGWLLVGQTWSAFGDVLAEPDSINREGFAASTHLRQPGARVTAPLGTRASLAFALETPEPMISGADSKRDLPDAILRFRFEEPEEGSGPFALFPGGGHVQVALVLRKLAAQGADGSTATAMGYGLSVAGRVAVPWLGRRDWLLAGVVAGKGVGRYVRDLEQTGGQDGVYDPTAGSLTALPVVSGYVALEHWWATSLRSTLAGGTVKVHSLDVQPVDALHSTDQLSLNLAWSPIRRIDLIAEVLRGRRANKNGERGTATQVQFGSTFRF